MDVVAERASISRQTLGRIERGDHAVSIGAVAAVMHALGLASLLERVLAADPVGEAIETENLPRRIRIRREPKAEL
jgi:hypothetical protein